MPSRVSGARPKAERQNRGRGTSSSVKCVTTIVSQVRPGPEQRARAGFVVIFVSVKTFLEREFVATKMRPNNGCSNFVRREGRGKAIST